MAQVRDEHKAKLKEMGVWADFVLFREDLEGQGLDKPTANKEAVRKFLGNEAAENPSQSFQRKAREKAQRLAAVGVVVPKSRATLELMPLSAFEGREASEAEVIRWVARSMTLADVAVADCPSPAAWSLLSACRKSPGFEASFWQTMYTKIIPRAVDDEPPPALDGTPTMELIDRIVAARDKAMGKTSPTQEGKVT